MLRSLSPTSLRNLARHPRAWFVDRFWKHPVARDFFARLGIYQYYPTRDRRLLEEEILPHYARRNDVRRVVFVGCDWYTQGYRRIFHQHDYWTIDFDPAKRRYGARNHIVGPMENLASWFAPDSVDLLICNGVFGFGLNRIEQVERAFAAVYSCLRPGGELLVGWNDMPERKPFPLEQAAAIRSFEPFVFPPLATHRFETGSRFRHVFDFYRKPTAAASDAALAI